MTHEQACILADVLTRFTPVGADGDEEIGYCKHQDLLDLIESLGGPSAATTALGRFWLRKRLSTWQSPDGQKSRIAWGQFFVDWGTALQDCIERKEGAA